MNSQGEPISFLVDENVDPRVYRALRRRYPNIAVQRIGHRGAPAFGAADPENLVWCETAFISLVTNNRHSMPAHVQAHLAAGRHVPGIFVLPAGQRIGEIVQRLALIWTASTAEEYVDQVVYLTQIT